MCINRFTVDVDLSDFANLVDISERFFPHYKSWYKKYLHNDVDVSCGTTKKYNIFQVNVFLLLNYFN